ncbi:TonB-dependent receptor [Dysgonomonas sp. 216]|uniref:TonB-dependent receptor n=1 Tax=Dysgonomonas sp. 216 TaxID=2302934 RepID=UPI0013D35B70|nr:TonB-dependent receptor [Dysgonomonas sp. 216]NDW18613.1 TonB-dependent receptor [Dysgonomonas sp. 216]
MTDLKKLHLFLVLLTIFPALSFGQSYRLSGSVIDSKTKEILIGVPIVIKERNGNGVATSEDGKYSVFLPEGNYTLVVNYLGYEEKTMKVSLSKNTKLDILLDESSVSLSEVVVSSARPDQNVSSPQTGVERLSKEEINLLPVLMGERDVIKAFQLLPGVKSASEGSAGFFVRGGSVDQNLILLDNVGLYNASHLMGFFSTFNPEVIRDAALYKGAMPAQFGERLASVMDVQQRNGDLQEYHISGGIGLISSSLNVEGPIKKGKSSFIVGARRTYADAIARLSGVEDAQSAYLYFYDLNARANFALSDDDMLTFSGFWGKDKMVVKDIADTDWGNLLGSLKWTHKFRNKWTSSTTVSANKYGYFAHADIGSEMTSKANITDIGIKQEFLLQVNPDNEWRFGLQSTYHNLLPGSYKKDTSNINLQRKYSLENGIYASNQLKLNDKLEVVYGLRLSAFLAMGGSDYYTMDNQHNIIDTTWHKSGKLVKTYINLEPRLSAAYKLNSFSSVKAAYARTTQNIHQLTYSAQGTPYDRWTSSNNIIKPQIADQVSLGYFRNFNNNTYEFSIEAYYKDMKNQIDFKDNADYEGYNTLETELLFGKGRAYGVELLFKKTKGRLTGWIGYTLSKSEKKIDGINENRWYNAYQDRPHEISIVGMYNLNAKWSLSAAWIYYTGNAITYPSGKAEIDGKPVMYFSERNGYRMPAYHRLDLGATCTLKKTKKTSSELAFSLYNAYGRENAYMIQFRENDDDPNKSTAYQYSLFRFIPSISWNFKF